MFRERNTNGAVSDGPGDGILRHPDGSINFDAYRAAIRREREAAIASSIQGAASFVRATLAWKRNVLTGKWGSTATKHHAHHTR
jgi:hypothetical protein